MYRLAVPFIQSTQNLSFHVVVVARTAEKCTKRRAELSFFFVPVAVDVVVS